jgi:hypothetical protein
MTTKSVVVISFLGLFLFSNSSFCATWQPPAGSDLKWNTTSNWWLSSPPSSTVSAVISSTDLGPVLVDYGCSGTCKDLTLAQFGYEARLNIKSGGSLHAYGKATLGNYQGTGTISVSGGTIDIDSTLTIGYSYSGSNRGYGVVNLQDGKVKAVGDIKIGDAGGYGTVTMTAGTLDTSGQITMLNGRINLFGGTMIANDLTFFPPSGTFDIRGKGTLIIRQNVTGIIGHSISSITACNGYGTVIIRLINGYTVITTDCNCPDSDLTEDCNVNMDDLAILAAQWLTHIES